MSVDAYIGLPRSGKSYSLVQDQILPALLRRDLKGNPNPRKIHTNLPLDLGMIALIHRVDTTCVTLWPEDGAAFAATFSARGIGDTQTDHAGCVHDGALVIYDEIHLQFSVTTRKDNPHIRGMAEWVSLHGHWGCDFCWVSQAYERVDVDIRRLTAVYVHAKSREKLPRGKGTFRRQLLLKDDTTHEPIFKMPIRDETIKIDPVIYRCYRSFDVGGSGATTNSGFHLPPYVKKYGIVFAVACVLLVVVMIKVSVIFWGMFHGSLNRSAGILKSTPVTMQVPGAKSVSESGKNAESAKKNLPIDGMVCINGFCDIYAQGELSATTPEDTVHAVEYHRVAP